MNEHRFRAFLQSRQWSDPLGRQFVDHAQHDQLLPDPGSWQELETYLKGHDAPKARIEAAEYVWQLYVEGR